MLNTKLREDLCNSLGIFVYNELLVTDGIGASTAI
jgi:hypothetical protein